MIKTEKSIVCFIILHYLNLNDTYECINSILNLDEQESVRIVVVDNASPDGSGKILKSDYALDNRICVLCRGSNDGFSKGNNAGVEFAKCIWNPGFYVVTNNDVIFQQADFISRIRDSYARYKFDVMGPDIYAPAFHAHQNPMETDPPSLQKTQSTIIKNTILGILLPILYKRVCIRHERGRRASSDKYMVPQSDVCLKGACTVYARAYVKEKNRLFFPETFFYYEEFIQAAYCRSNHKTVVYDPELKVIHKDGASISKSNKEMYDRCKYTLKVTRASARIYRNYLLRIKNKCQTKEY